MTRYTVLFLAACALAFVAPQPAPAGPAPSRASFKKMSGLCDRAKPNALYCLKAGVLAVRFRRPHQARRMFRRGCDVARKSRRSQRYQARACQRLAQWIERQGVNRPRAVKRYYAKACRLGLKSACRPVASAGDRDGDGVADNTDLCPDAPEDRDGFEDADGCPDPDNDRDRILDVNDKCPNAPETYNGIDDTDGCPDRGRVVVTTTTHSQVPDKIYFTHNNHKFTARSQPILNAIIGVLKGNSKVRLVEVRGHAAPNEASKRMLSARRANQVREYLVRGGIARSRLRAKGYSDRQPVDRRATAYARAKNRRVSFQILKR